MRKSCRMFTRPDWGKSGMKVDCGVAANIPDLNLLKSGLPLVCKTVIRCRGGHVRPSCVQLLQRLRASDVPTAPFLCVMFLTHLL